MAMNMSLRKRPILLVASQCVRLRVLFVPSHPFTKRRYVRDVMPSVPCIQTDILRQADQPNLRMSKRAREVSRRLRLHQQDPTLVKRFKHRERDFNRRGARVFEFSPTVFVVSLDCWFVFGERELEPAVAV